MAESETTTMKSGPSQCQLTCARQLFMRFVTHYAQQLFKMSRVYAGETTCHLVMIWPEVKADLSGRPADSCSPAFPTGMQDCSSRR